MKYNEAVKHKKEAVDSADDIVLENYHIIITPTNTEESQKHIEAFLENTEKFDDKSCKEFSSDDDYQVVSFKKEDPDK